jgi:hypothetical protein
MSDNGKKKKNAEAVDDISLAANTEMLGRYSEAGKQFAVAYDGIDNETGQKQHQGLKQISEYQETSISKDGKIIDNTKTQQGYSAEVLDTAKQNSENIKKGSSERVSRTDDVTDPQTGKKRVNDPNHDQVTLDSEGNIITGSGVQVKFYEPDSFVDFVTGKKRAKHGKLWVDKYSDGKFSVPADQYDEIKRKLKEEIEALENANDLTTEQQRRLDYIKKVDKNLKKSKVSKTEAVEARKKPEKVTAKEIAKTSHEAGVEAAKVGAMVGGGISVITNTMAVLKGEKEVDEAIGDTVIDTAKAGATSYATGFTNTALASVMKNSSNELARSLGKANAPAYIIQTAISTMKSLVSLCNAEITVNEFFLEIGKNGTTLLASAQGAVIGQLLIPVPVVGALVGGLVSTLLCGAIYDCTIGMKMLNAEIDEFSNRLADEMIFLKEYQARLMQFDIDRFKRETGNFNTVADYISGDYTEQDFNLMLKLTYEYIGIPCPWGNGALDDFMQNKKGVLTFG